MSLADKHIVDIAVGAEHTICVTSAGDIFGFGSNTDGQLGLGHTLTVREPEKIGILSGRGVQQVINKLIIQITNNNFHYLGLNMKYLL